MTPSERRFRRLIRSLLARDIKPTPTLINRYLGRQRSRLNSINGREAAWRRAELLAAGWTDPWVEQRQYASRPNSWIRWEPPR